MTRALSALHQLGLDLLDIRLLRTDLLDSLRYRTHELLRKFQP